MAATLRPVARTFTTPELAETVGVSGQTLRRWAQVGLLPAPEKVHRGRRGTVSEWLEAVVEQARWVLAQLEAGKTIPKFLAAPEAGEYPTRLQPTPGDARVATEVSHRFWQVCTDHKQKRLLQHLF